MKKIDIYSAYRYHIKIDHNIKFVILLNKSCYEISAAHYSKEHYQ